MTRVYYPAREYAEESKSGAAILYNGSAKIDEGNDMQLRGILDLDNLPPNAIVYRPKLLPNLSFDVETNIVVDLDTGDSLSIRLGSRESPHRWTYANEERGILVHGSYFGAAGGPGVIVAEIPVADVVSGKRPNLRSKVVAQDEYDLERVAEMKFAHSYSHRIRGNPPWNKFTSEYVVVDTRVPHGKDIDRVTGMPKDSQ